MANSFRDELMKLPAKALADALLKLAAESNFAADVVERLLSTPKQSLSRFEQRLADLKHQDRFYDWRSTSRFSRDLSALLEDLDSAKPGSEEGLRQIATFFESDEAIFNSCDDSSGQIGTLFKCDATEIFIKYAFQCTNKEFVVEMVIKLNTVDSYGVRDSLVEEAEKYLPEKSMRIMADKCWDHCLQ